MRRADLISRFVRWLTVPQPILRLEIIRVLAPLLALGFMSGRVAHADEFLGQAGFHVPDLGGGDYRQPLYVPPLANGVAWSIAIVFVLSALALSAGFRTRVAALGMALSLAFIALADRLAAFTVTKMSPTLAFALFLSPAGARFGIDAWRRAKQKPAEPLPTEVASGAVRFFQGFILAMYFGSGVAKLRGEWLTVPHLLWTHVHDSYQTWFSWALANAMPAFVWTVLQGVVPILEAGAPIWFSWKKTRPIALVLAMGMHAMIGLMFGPVKWFAMLMMTLVFASFAPDAWLEAIARRLGRRFG